MRRSQILGFLAIAAFGAILFTSPDTNYWIYFLILGIIFGIFWFIRKKS